MRPTATSLSLPLLALALAVAPAAQADDDRGCRHSAPQSLALDIGDARTIEFHVGNGRLRLDDPVRFDAALARTVDAYLSGVVWRLRDRRADQVLLSALEAVA